MDKIKVNNWITNHSHPIPAIIEDILPDDTGDYILIAGRTGIGKSVLAIHLAYSLATGTPFLGFPTKKVTVGYLAMEGGKTNWRDRLLKIKTQYPDTDQLYFNLEQPMPLSRYFNELKSAYADCRVVIWDNLRQVTTGKYLDPNYASEWLKSYQQFLKDIEAVGVLTHHIKKRDDRYLIEPDDVYNLKGATEYVDASTTVMLLERKRQRHLVGEPFFKKTNTNEIMLYFAKARIANKDLTEMELHRNYDKCSFDVMGEPVMIRGN